MKKLSAVLIAAALMALAIPAFAQNAGPKTGGQQQGGRQGGPGGGRMMWGRMGEEATKKALDAAKATDDQKKKVKALMDKNQKARTEFMEKTLKIKMPTPGQGGQGQRPQLTEEQRTKLRDFSQKQMTASTAEMKKILGDKYEAFQKALMAEMQKMRQGGGGRPGQGGAGKPGQGGSRKPPM